MKTLLLIPSVLKQDVGQSAHKGLRPEMDYHALAHALRAAGGEADLIGYDELDAEKDPAVRAIGRTGGRDAALAMIGFLRSERYDAIFTNGENIAIPLALLLKGKRRRPGHVTIGHRPSTGKKRPFFQYLRVQEQIDRMLVYATTQHEFSRTQLGVPSERLQLIHFHADEGFFRPQPDIPVESGLISAAGLEWRDYPTLIEALETMPELTLSLAAASPWSKHRNETEKRVLPSNVTARRYEYNELRELYARSSIVAVPLYENDFQAGVTSLLEAMAMGKPVIVTKTTGQTDIVIDGVNGLTVAPGDVDGWRKAILRLRNDAGLQQHLGMNARRWVLENATLGRWVGRITTALQDSAGIPRSTGVSYDLRDSSPVRSHQSIHERQPAGQSR